MKRKINTIKQFSALTLLFYICCTVMNPLYGQTKAEVTVGLSYYMKADNTKALVALVKKNEDGKFVFAKNTPVNFYVVQQKEQLLLKTVNTDNHGKAMIILDKDLPLDDSMFFNVVAKVENNPLFEDAQDQIHIKYASLTLSMDPKDTSKLVTARVTEKGKDGTIIPVKGAEVKFYVQRLFGFLPAAEENMVATDEKGEASFSYPKNIPGDTAGIITVAARLEDNDHYGNLENKASQSWGTVLPIIKEPFPRALFEPHAPLPLVITISTLFGGVWLVYFFIFYQLRKIKKEGMQIIKHSPTAV